MQSDSSLIEKYLDICPFSCPCDAWNIAWIRFNPRLFSNLLWICMYSPRKSKPTQLYTKIATVDNISSHSCVQHSRLIIFSFITTVMILLVHGIYGCTYCLHGCEPLLLRISVHLIDLRAVGHGEMLAKFWSGHWRKLWWFNAIILNACVSFLAVAETVRLAFVIISSWAFILFPLLLLWVAGGLSKTEIVIGVYYITIIKTVDVCASFFLH